MKVNNINIYKFNNKMEDKLSSTTVLFITSIYAIYLFTVYLLHINQNIYSLQILNGAISLLSICILIKLYYSLKDYNSRWRNIQDEILR